jgi:E3 ubiquitin-protein ligase HECTD3
VYGVKIFTNIPCANEHGLNTKVFLAKNIEKSYPSLSAFDATFLYYRSMILIRFIRIFDIVMDAILPSWLYGQYFLNLCKNVKKLLVLSSKRTLLFDKIMNSIPTSDTSMALINIDRPLAFAYRGKVDLDPKYQNTIFMQIYNKINTQHEDMTFRWTKERDQWWECKFIGEGIIDQGGGFRDSLSDISEELCPNTTVDVPVPLPFFIRSPNQFNSDSNTFKDTFIPNPACQLFSEYEFIGKLMGACLRSKENLALYLAPTFWKKISEEKMSWNNDFVTVDSSEVRILDMIEKMTREEYEEYYGKEKTWTCILSDGTIYKMDSNSSTSQSSIVSYEERLDYCQQVKRIRMSESDKQIDAIKRGLQSVLSKHIFYMLTWSEFEFKICGVSQISIEDLKMSVEYEDSISYQSVNVKYFWEAMENFTNEERSKFVRFVTGRKRQPVKIYFCLSDTPPDGFPDSSTCSGSLYFPIYPSAKIAEDKLRYAINNCIGIDTDCSSYDDYLEYY